MIARPLDILIQSERVVVIRSAKSPTITVCHDLWGDGSDAWFYQAKKDAKAAGFPWPKPIPYIGKP